VLDMTFKLLSVCENCKGSNLRVNSTVFMDLVHVFSFNELSFLCIPCVFFYISTSSRKCRNRWICSRTQFLRLIVIWMSQQKMMSKSKLVFL